MNRKHVEVVAAIIQYQDLYLLVQRPFKGEVGGKWEFPGGKVEPFETQEASLKREIVEELAINLDKMGHMLTSSHSYVGFDITIHFYLCPIDHQVLELKEHIAFRWLKKTEIPFIDLADADKSVIADI